METKPLAQALLEERLGYRFRDRDLLRMALTHPSYGSDHHVSHYQRLEFLGDAVLELSISRILYDAFGDWSEGRLTRTRAELVREEAVSEVAQEMDLGAFIYLSTGEERSGGRQRPSILCDVQEAVLGAVYLDGGFDAAFHLIGRLWGERLDPDRIQDTLDAKTTLQEILQRTGQVPVYEMISEEGPSHCPVFTFRVCAGGAEMGRGTSGSKQRAQQAAAREALARIQGKSGEEQRPCD